MDTLPEEGSGNLPDKPPKTPSGLDQLLSNADVAKSILHAVDVWEKKVGADERVQTGDGKRFLIMALVLFFIITLSVSLLTWFDRISGEATGFLFGVIITGAIAVLRDLTGGRN